MLTIRHIELADANCYVAAHHRHHKAVRGHRFSLACHEDGRLCGVAIVGRPRSRRIDQHSTVEVLRLCTDGTGNACSKLYGACRKAAKALGYDRLITYILENEDSASLWAAFPTAIPTRLRSAPSIYTRLCFDLSRLLKHDVLEWTHI